MTTRQRLGEWLRSRSPEQLDLIMARAGIHPHGRTAPRDQARVLLQHHVTIKIIEFCTLPQLQALSAIVWAAERRHGPFGDQYWRDDDPADRAVPRAEVLELLAGSDTALRAAAEAVLGELGEMALVLPPHGDELIVPNGAHHALADAPGFGRPAAQLIAAHFNAPDVHRIAGALGLGKFSGRQAAESKVLDFLADSGRVRALLATAPESTRAWAATIARQGSRVRTHVFHSGGHGYGTSAKFTLRPGGSGDPNTDWLAQHGLLLPAGARDTAELPLEVAEAVLGELRLPFSPRPPEPPDDLTSADHIDGSAQTAVAAAASQLERLLAACAAQPLSVRKAGGIAVRDTKRVAKALGVTDEVTRFWIDLCAQAGLLALHTEPVPRPKGHRGKLPDPPVTVLPTAAYDRWLDKSTPERLAPIISAWAVVDEIYTFWPDPEDTPVALIEPSDPYAVGLRYALLDALAALPDGRGVDAHALPYLVARSSWRRPFRVGPDSGDRITATLREAELLGVTAQGALTAVGRAVLDLLRTRQAWTTPEPALVEALIGLLPRPQTTAFFQADLTAVVAGLPDSALAALLDAAATRESEGHAVVWRFSALTVRRALDAGYDCDELLTRLAAVAQAPLPQPLEYLIKDVGRSHGRMRVVRSGCCIRSDDAALLDELAGAKALRGLGLRKIAPTVLISTAGERETLDGLRSAGYTPVLESETGTTIIERTPKRRATGRRR